jgi:hypothetical protein
MGKNNRTVLVKPAGGLCNRLRVVISALILAEHTGRKCSLLWKPYNLCNCKYSDLFSYDPIIDVIPIWYLKISRRLDLLPFRKVINKTGIIIDQGKLKEIGWIIDACQYENYDYLFFKDCYSDFIPSNLSPEEYKDKISYYLQRLKPLKLIQKKLFDIPPNTVGVHVRRKDNHLAREVSTEELFIENMHHGVSENQNVQFFLATDDPIVETRFKNIFHDRIIVYKKSAYSRNQKEAIQDALVDLLLLSRCEKILGSYYSSFGDIASLFRKIDLYIVGKGIWEGPASAIYNRR